LSTTLAFPRSRGAAYGALLFTAALWGSSGVMARGLLDQIPPVALVYLRWLVVLAGLLPFAWPERTAMIDELRTHSGGYARLALVGFAPQTCLVYFGLVGSTATVLGLLNSAIPVMIVALMAVLRGRQPRPLEAVGLALSCAGVAFILARGDARALLSLRFQPSDLMLLAGMAVWAYYTIKLSERPSHLSLPAFMFLAASLGLVLAAPLLVYELVQRGVPRIGTNELLGIVYLGTLPTLVAMLLFGHAVVRVGAVQGGIFTHLVPVFTAAFAAAFLGERLEPYHAAGFVLVAGGAILCCLRPEPMLSSRAPARPPPVR
jgi:drug/metabolite transporter (DMT)-like permease